MLIYDILEPTVVKIIMTSNFFTSLLGKLSVDVA